MDTLVPLPRLHRLTCHDELVMLPDNAISGMSETTMAIGVRAHITEENFEKEKGKEQAPSKIEAADRIKSKLFHREICKSYSFCCARAFLTPRLRFIRLPLNSFHNGIFFIT